VQAVLDPTFDPEPVPIAPEPRRSRHRVGAAVAIAVFAALVLATIGVAAASHHHPASHLDNRRGKPSVDSRLKMTKGAQVKVLAALSTTTSSGSFAVSYQLSGTEATAPTTTPSPVCQPVDVVKGASTRAGGPGTVRPTGGTVCMSYPSQAPVTVTGSGTIDTNPKAMVVSASISTGLDVSVRLDDEDVWEEGGADYGNTPQASDGSTGQPLSGFADLVEGTLGQREGAIAMLGMASPSGYLDLESSSITGATAQGSGTVDGVPVTYYDVTVDPSKLADLPGITADEVSTINSAVGVLQQAGYTGTTARVALDGDGYIREVSSVASFADGGTVTLDSTFSNFGCAGTVTMPGQPPAPPPGACSTPAPTTSAPTTSIEPTTTTTEPPTTTAPVSTTYLPTSTTSATSTASTPEPPPTSGPPAG
jgi:hypothetical protein